MISRMSETDPAEAAVRAYLLFLRDPSQLVDVAEATRLEEAASNATDPIAKLRTLAALSNVRQPDELRLKQDFIQHARTWAEANRIPVALFREVGVSTAVLRSAGMTGSRTEAVSRTETPHVKSVSAKTIRQHISQMKSNTFTLADIGNSVGGSPMTIRKAVEGLVEEGSVRRIGTKSDWTGPGRAPIEFATQR